MNSLKRHLSDAHAEMSALGPRPARPRKGFVLIEPPEARIWDARAIRIGRCFIRSVWTAALAGDAACRGYIEAWIDTDSLGLAVTDAEVRAFAAQVTPRLAVALSGVEPQR